LWKGAISFGLVNIPIRLYAATERRDPRFHYLHGECGSPIRYVKWCPYCKREVPAEEVVWGYEYERDKYVLFTDEELEALQAVPQKTIAIEDFIDMREVDPIFFDRAYFLEPVEGGARAYALLRRAMDESGRVAVARVAIRSKETLATVRTYGARALVMETMFWPDEVRPGESLAIPFGDEPEDREVQMATTLVNMLSSPFEPSKYRSDRRERLTRAISAKVEGRGVEAIRAPGVEGIADLAEALRHSIEAAQRRRTGGAAGPVQ
jgi:DNA end-binding protein Ku